ncbi:hypothetical protein Y032_0081g1441 [Ancylostoma ceylanicum]|uniref:RecA family profile 1 domain-containing protein n=1 Tax=Ancylostoma ceylanicum TaxID=53326 RepID=A0A016TRC0_9BILA|nr:hypothetical protein Y032_0081g1441 [Ancylostoma ceylanicum]
MCSSESAIDAAVALGLPLALRTGLADIDKVLHNDLQYGELSEIVGASGAGKTQLCYNLVAHYLLHTKFSVAWLDSNGSFRAHRLQEYIAGCDGSLDDSVDSFLERVAVTRVTDQMQLIEALELIDDYFEDYCIRLVIIDNTFEMFDERLLGEGVGRSAIMTMILNRIDTLTGAGCTVVTTSSITQEEDERRELMKTWIQHLRGRVLLEDDGGIRIILSLNLIENAGPLLRAGRAAHAPQALRARNFSTDCAEGLYCRRDGETASLLLLCRRISKHTSTSMCMSVLFFGTRRFTAAVLLPDHPLWASKHRIFMSDRFERL